VSIKPETVFFFQGLPITNSLLTSFIVTIIMIVMGLYFSANINSNSSKFVTFIRFVLVSLHDMFKTILGDLHEKAFPLLLSFFFYILISNWFGLLPGVGSITITPPAHKAEAVVHEEAVKEESHKPEAAHGRIPLLRGTTADLNATIALALVAFAAIQFFGFTTLGVVGYAKKFINISNPINFFIGVLELISEFSKILSFAFRLFGNIFAGEVLLSVMAFLVPVLASFPFLLMEIFVGLVQAIVFSMLTGVFISSAVAGHDDHH
jgi:F-type H+-transporting ATPase subunit a